LFVVYNDLGGSRRAWALAGGRVCTVCLSETHGTTLHPGRGDHLGCTQRRPAPPNSSSAPGRAARRSNPSGSRIIATRSVPSSLDDSNNLHRHQNAYV